MKKFLAAGLMLLLPSGIEAKPWYRDWKALSVLGASAGSAVAFGKLAHDCRVRTHEPGPCAGEYTSPALTLGLRIGATAGMDAITLWGRHEGYKEWSAPALGFTAFTAVEAYRQTLPQPSNKPDLSDVAVLSK